MNPVHSPERRWRARRKEAEYEAIRREIAALKAAAKELNMEIRWEGQGVDEKGYRTNPPKTANSKLKTPIIAVDARYFRPTEVANPAWRPNQGKRKTRLDPQIAFDELVAEMVQEDLKSAERDELITRHGSRSWIITNEMPRHRSLPGKNHQRQT